MTKKVFEHKTMREIKVSYGDWVRYVPYGTVVRVDSGILDNIYRHGKWYDYAPVEITESILESSGFVPKEYEDGGGNKEVHWTRKVDEGRPMELGNMILYSMEFKEATVDSPSFHSSAGGVLYVHELQHMMACSDEKPDMVVKGGVEHPRTVSVTDRFLIRTMDLVERANRTADESERIYSMIYRDSKDIAEHCSDMKKFLGEIAGMKVSDRFRFLMNPIPLCRKIWSIALWGNTEEKNKN